MAERWRKLESGEERPSLELQSSARRSAQEIEAIRRSRYVVTQFVFFFFSYN